MPDERPPVPVALRDRREQTIEALCAHFANDVLTMEQLESRLDQAQRARTLAELESLLTDLPVPVKSGAPAGATSPGSTVPAPRRPAVPVQQKDHQTLVAIMGGVERRGVWTPARNSLVLAVMGGTQLDFREALLEPGVTDISVFAMMGGVEIIVPPELPVDVGGVAIMGGFSHRELAGTPSPDRPSLHVSGFVLMGGVDVQVRMPGETKRDAHKRRREERREARRQRRHRER